MFFRQNPSDVRPKTEPPHCSIRAPNLISSLGSTPSVSDSHPPFLLIFKPLQSSPPPTMILISSISIIGLPSSPLVSSLPSLPPSSPSIESKYAYRDLLRPPRSHPRLQSDLSHGTESDQIILQDTDARSLSDVKMENAFEIYFARTQHYARRHRCQS